MGFARTITALLLLLSASAMAGEDAARALPLNRFPSSRATQTDAAGFYFMPTGIGDDYFDGASDLKRVRRHFKIARKAGVKYFRCAFSWNGIEKSPGQYEWSFWDMLVREAEKAHIQLIPYVAYTPEWAAAKSDEFWKQPPRDTRLFADFMYQAARRYRGRIRSWEIWNEPDLTEYWQGSVELFAQLVREAAVEIRRADPAAVLVLGGVSLGPSSFFHELIEQHHIDRYVDVIATHGYPESWHSQRAETIYREWIPEMHEIETRSGAGDDLWANEMGYPDFRYSAAQATRWGNTPVFYSYEHTAPYSAAELFKGYVMALASGDVSLISWYRVDDFPASETRLGEDGVHYHLGVVDVRGRPKPTFRALLFFNRLFDQPTRTLREDVESTAGKQSQAVVNIVEKKNGKMVISGWLRSSRDDEIADRSGSLTDMRSETIAVHLPCARADHVRYFDAEGRRDHPQARFEPQWIRGIPLTGANVFVAEFACRRD